ncbi:hypothetical protein CEE37_07745 [candidate division LCP-89 bacterium B3_LCP]|uniref:TonB-dependent receptor plug domain-containing protein n=1 Tax=candidate division LCP-89 bacterium B3_LCP TaxID=2012998 RepID=A0A532V0V6_UNCL8|nr:MAG: hypothetical protein CEE37_07745 [candidate division LCP-89 bacterium B3_LCP]
MKYTIKWVVVALIIITSVYSAMAATNGKIAGRVVDKDSGEPLPAVNVVIEGTTLGATTDLDGQYFILIIPPGRYVLRATMVGYKDMSVQNVLVQTDLTTRINFELEATILDVGEVVVVVAERPLIEPDVTGSRMTTSAAALALMPIDDMEDILTLTAGAVEEDGSLHIRGGRNREVAFMIDGALVADPVTGAFDGDIPEMALEEVSVQTGGFGAEYGSAQSGIINMILKEGGPRYSGAFRMKTSDFSGYRTDPWHEQLWNVEGSFGGPVPYVKDLRFYLSGEWESDKGRFPNDDQQPLTMTGKLTYNVTPKIKLTANGTVYMNDYTVFDRGTYDYNLYRRNSFEDLNSDFSQAQNPLLVDGSGNPWYGNGQMDSEWVDYNNNGTYEEVWIDTDNDGIKDTNAEFNDLNGNGILDSEDLNANGSMDSYNMLDNTPEFIARNNQFGVTLTHTLNQKTFYEVRLNEQRTYLKWNILENTNEDSDGDGRFDHGEDLNGNNILDAGEDYNGNGVLDLTEDLNGNGSFDFELDSNHDGIPDYGYDLGLDGLPFTGDLGENDGITTTEDMDGDGRFDANEDLNGNGLWDYLIYGPDHDLYVDENHNGYVDASEIGDQANWIPMTELPMFGVGEKDDDGFFDYGVGNTYHRDRWHEDESYSYNMQYHITSQVNPHHQLKAGVEATYYDIMVYDVDAASGGNIYGEDYSVFPHSFATYVQDKMEFEGLIVNAGIRFDYFNANYDYYPSDITDPVLDYTVGGEIKNPTSVPAKYAWSPRLGISHPITDRDVLYFNYGHYFQVPRLNYLFENITFQLYGAFPRMGNANLEPEQTTSYELGIKHQFADDLVLNVTGFFKDITGLTDTQQIYYSASNWYGIYQNTDYGNVRGFEVTLIRPRISYMSGTLTYTYSFARGKNSSPTADYVTIWEGNNVPTTETYLDWDQRHTVSANLDLRTLNDEQFFGIPHTDNLGFNFILGYGSGMPWSPPTRDQDKWKYENTERMPYTVNLDMIVDKGFYWNNLYTKFFIEVRNLFDKVNIYDIDDEEWYALQVDASGNRIYDADGAYDNPTVYGARRLIRLGVGMEF